MTTHPSPAALQPDPAAIFAIAHSLWAECHRRTATEPHLNLSACYSGMDGFMREIMRVATTFEAWSCQHVDFAELTDVWPYLLQDRFGHECLSVLLPEALSEFDAHDCRRIAARLRLAIR